MKPTDAFDRRHELLVMYLAEHLRRLPDGADDAEIAKTARQMATDIFAAIGEIGELLMNDLQQRDRDELARLEDWQGEHLCSDHRSSPDPWGGIGPSAGE